MVGLTVGLTGIYALCSILTIVGASHHRRRCLIVPYLVIQMFIIVMTIIAEGKILFLRFKM